MNQQHQIHTVTMARIYTQQGHYRKAADIYRHLLENDPTRKDLADDLAEVEAKERALHHSGKKDLAPLLRQWIKLAVRYRQVQQLNRMKQFLAQTKADISSDL